MTKCSPWTRLRDCRCDGTPRDSVAGLALSFKRPPSAALAGFAPDRHAAAAGFDDDLCAAGDVEPAEDGHGVAFHGPLRKPELPADLLRGHAAQQAAQDVGLPRSEPEIGRGSPA